MKISSILFGILIGVAWCIQETSQIADSPPENPIARNRATESESSTKRRRKQSITNNNRPSLFARLLRRKKRRMASDNKSNAILGYTVQEMQVGVLASAESQEYAEKLAGDVRRMFPDRFRVIVLDAEDVEDWPKLQVLVLAASKPSFPHEKANQYVEKHNEDMGSPLLVLTDFDLARNLSDRRILYNVLVAGGLLSYLPRYGYVNRDGFTDQQDQKVFELVDRRDQIEVNGRILLKPVMERPVDPTDPEVRVYYPRSDGGGCKIIKFSDKEDRNHTARFESDVAHIQRGSALSFIYEELSDVPLVQIRTRERKRDQLKKLVTSKKGSPPASFGDDDQISDVSDLSRMDRKIVIVTTASLPWMTGTAVNPLLRAAYLTRGRPKGSVTLVIPWLDKEDDQAAVYGAQRFSSKEEQEIHVRTWLRDQAGMPEAADPETGIKIIWYSSRYVPALGSIFPVGDICKLIPDEDADFCILEEPEHLNWIRGEGEGEIWTEKFKHVVGVIHTNYRAYASQTSAGLIAAPFVTGLSTLMVRAYCDKVIKLSATLQTYSPEKEVVSNVHGVRSDFLKEGKRRAEQMRLGGVPEVDDNDAPVAYFIGKLLWDKGLDHLLRLEYFYKAITGEFFPIDIVGDGPDRPEIEAAFKAENRAGKVTKTIRKLLAIDDDDANDQSVDMSIEDKLDSMDAKRSSLFELPSSMILSTDKVPGTFHGRKDHAQFCTNYRVLVNPSTTEVLCTTVAEALAMGKFVIIPKHPSNEFFYQFPNCLVYDNKAEFVRHMHYALSNEPEPLTEEQSHIFTWEAATDRLVQASSITMREGRVRAKAKKEGHDKRIAKTYNKLGARGELLRMILDGEGPLKKPNQSEGSSSADG